MSKKEISRDEKIKIINDFIIFIKEVFSNKINYSEYGHYSYELIDNNILKQNVFHSNNIYFYLNKKHYKSIDYNYKEIINIIDFKKEEWNKWKLKNKLSNQLQNKEKNKVNKI